MNIILKAYVFDKIDEHLVSKFIDFSEVTCFKHDYENVKIEIMDKFVRFTGLENVKELDKIAEDLNKDLGDQVLHYNLKKNEFENVIKDDWVKKGKINKKISKKEIKNIPEFVYKLNLPGLISCWIPEEHKYRLVIIREKNKDAFEFYHNLLIKVNDEFALMNISISLEEYLIE